MTTQSSQPPKAPRYNLPAWAKLALYLGVVVAAFLSVRLVQVMAQYGVNSLGGMVMLSHTAVALVASLLTAWMLLAPKGTATHKTMGRIWSVMLVFIALSSFALRDGFGAAMGWPLGLGPIHLLSALTIYSVTHGVVAIRRGQIQTHIANMVGVCWALLIAGAFTLLPGRLMHQLAIFVL